MRARRSRQVVLTLLMSGVVLGLAGCVVGGGPVVQETREVQGFERVVLEGSGDVELVPGEREGVTVEANRSLLSRVKTEVRGRTLYLGLRSPAIFVSGPVRYRVSFIKVAGLEALGSGHIRARQLSSESVDLRVGGSGGIVVDSLAAERLEVDLTGSGKVEIGGEVGDQDVTISGSGDYLARDLSSQSARIGILGSGNADLTVHEALDVSISGSGDVSYYGDPTVEQRILGSGVVRSRGSR